MTIKRLLLPLLSFFVVLSSASAVPFITVNSAVATALTTVDSTGTIDPNTGAVRHQAVVGTFPSFDSNALILYFVGDSSLTLSSFQVRAQPSKTGEVLITFTTTKPVLIEHDTVVKQGNVSTTFNGSTTIPAQVPAGTYTIRLTAIGGAAVDAEAFGAEHFVIKEGAATPQTFRWRSYESGLWDDTARWNPTGAPGEIDSVIFSLVPTVAAQRTVPLPDLVVTSTNNAPHAATKMAIARSSVALKSFDLDLKGGQGVPNALAISSGGSLLVEVADPRPPGGRANLTTAGTVIGQGTSFTLSPGKVLRACTMDIAPNVLWKNTGDITIGETMRGELTIASRFNETDRNGTTGDVQIGTGNKVGGVIKVTGDFVYDFMTAGAARGGVAQVIVTKGGLLEGSDALLAPLRDSQAVVVVDDKPVDEEGTSNDYTSQNQSTQWLVDSLELSGLANGGAGSREGGTADLGILNGGDVKAFSATLGNILPRNGVVATATADVVVDGIDPLDGHQSFFLIDGPLTVGPFSPARVHATSGGAIRAKSVAIKSRGTIRVENPFTNDSVQPPQIVKRSQLDVVANSTTNPATLGPVSIDGGGLLFVNTGGQLNCSDLTLGGVSRSRAARCRFDESDPALADGVLNVGNVNIGTTGGFPGLLELVTAAISVDQFVTIETGSTLSGDGLIVFRNPASQLTNRGKVIVPPGAGKPLQISGDYIQPSPGKLILTVNRQNVSTSAPLVVLGTSVQLNGTIELRFSGNRLPRRGEVFALIRAENATITNNATIRVTGAAHGFDVVQDDLSIVVVFR